MLSSTLLVAAIAAPAVLGASVPRTKTTVATNLFTPTNYTVVKDIFIQDSPTFSSSGYDAFSDSLGLIDKTAKRWENLQDHINALNRGSDSLTAYKLIYIARHGQGYHNLAESTYGTPAWNCYWSEQYTDGNITWGPDATLTDLGVTQALAAKAAFTTQAAAGMPLPQVLYSSPMRRAAATLQLSWDDLLISKGMTPIVKEALRESIGLHTCDQRSTKSVIASTFPTFSFEAPFSEHDELWGPDYQESNGQQPLRLQQFLNWLFATDSSSIISITAHSGVINSFFKAIGHNAFSVQTGGVVPVLIKAVGHASATNTAIIGGPSATKPTCAAGVVVPTARG
ncbi:histidine phosphatase superfamily [Leucosporidium creatinivorum]|uniref:Histidine phosphatase superfamily n=1 Tax=Leucosporidium creatinivorum TaxID=106004 RepID=A0A1Y2FEI9_9BASI|nr:histidine phosphatase superfamily [Leucosporidium creatinivorum]